MRAALAAEIERLRPLGRGIGWVAAGSLHVTLKFLGEIDPALIDAIGAAVSTLTERTPAFTLTVEGLGAFPSMTRPRVVWAGLGGGVTVLASLAARIDAGLGDLGLAREARPFAGHVTLGRVREPRRDPDLAAAIATARERSFGAFRVNEITLMQSQLHPNGARYTALRHWALQSFPGETAGRPSG